MKQQVTRLSPHHNGKVFAVLMTITSLVFLVPFSLLAMANTPEGTKEPMFILLTMPLMYLVFGYLSVAIGCKVYNFMFKYIGGIEFESKTENDA